MSGRQEKSHQYPLSSVNEAQHVISTHRGKTPESGRAGFRVVYGALFLLFAVSVIAFSGCSKKNLPAGEKEFSEGMTALELGDTTRAYQLFTEAAKNDPARPWNKLGEAKEIELYSSPFGAMRSYIELMAIAPDFDSAFTGYCRLALQYGKPLLAWNAAQQYAHNRDINVENDAGKATSAERIYSLIVADVLRLRGDVENAESRLTRLTESFPNDGEVAIALANVKLQQGQIAEALPLVEKALDSDGDSHAIVTGAIEFYTEAGYADKALALLRQVRDNEKPNNIRANRLAVETYLGLGYIDYAALVVSQMKQDGIKDGLAYYLNGRIAEARGNYVQAKEWYLYSLSMQTNNLELYRDAARASTSARNFIIMENNMNGVLLKLSAPKYPADYIADAHLQFAEFYVALSQWRQSLGELEKARGVFSGTPRFELLRARTLFSMQDKDSAFTALTYLASRYQSSFEWLRGLGLTYTEIGINDSAKLYVQKALALQPDDFISLVANVDIARKTNDTAGYAKAIETIAHAYPRNKRAMRMQADYYLWSGDNVSALDVANHMIELYPGDLSAYNYAATLAGSRYGNEQGVKYLTDAKQNNSDIPAPYRKLASFLLRQGQIDSAEGYWAEAYAIDSTDEATLLTKGVLLEAKGFPDSAVAVYKQIINADPFSAEAFNNLAWVMANNNLNPAQASNFAREAIGLSGGLNGNLHGTLGWALFKEKKYKQASASMQTAIKFNPRDPFKRYMYGTILEAQDKKKEAILQYQQALDLGLQGAYRQDVEQTIARLKG